MNLHHLLDVQTTTIVTLVAWGACLGWAAYLRRWRMVCAFACLMASAVLRDLARAEYQKMAVIALSVLAVMLLMVDIRNHARRRRFHD